MRRAARSTFRGRRSRRGESATEYAVLLGGMAVVLLLVMLVFGDVLANLFGSAQSVIAEGSGGGGQSPGQGGGAGAGTGAGAGGGPAGSGSGGGQDAGGGGAGDDGAGEPASEGGPDEPDTVEVVIPSPP